MRIGNIFLLAAACAFAVLSAGCAARTVTPSEYDYYCPDPCHDRDCAERLFEYYDSGEYFRDLEYVARRAADYLRSLEGEPGKNAVVLDIDETSLSNWEELQENRFCYDRKVWEEWVEEARAVAIRGTLGVYDLARSMGMACFFVTGRDEPQREATVKNLKDMGFTGWEGLYMEDGDYGSAADFKSAVRGEIESMGYTIVLNMGDQHSDLSGGRAGAVYKLPNPFYYVP